jgi:hypothetical protein
MGTLYGLDYFDQVQYRVVHKGDDNTLVIRPAAGAAAPTTCAWA